MTFDNRIFNVNGIGDEMLLMTLKLAFAQEEGGEKATCRGYAVHIEHGLILLWSDSEAKRTFPAPMTANQVFPVVLAWLKSEAAKEIPCNHWDSDFDHDGSNGLGWRVFVEDCGHVGNLTCVICAVRPAYVWYGK